VLRAATVFDEDPQYRFPYNWQHKASQVGFYHVLMIFVTARATVGNNSGP